MEPVTLRKLRALFDHHGDRFRWKIGDLYSEGEREAGGFGWSGMLGIDFGIGIDTGEFDRLRSSVTVNQATGSVTGGHGSEQYVSHTFLVGIIRWGIFLSVRGRRIQ